MRRLFHQAGPVDRENRADRACRLSPGYSNAKVAVGRRMTDKTKRRETNARLDDEPAADDFGATEARGPEPQ
jgi:hypothetical protein